MRRRLMEQRLAKKYNTIIGRDGANYRGNRQSPIAASRIHFHEQFEGCLT